MNNILLAQTLKNTTKNMLVYEMEGCTADNTGYFGITSLKKDQIVCYHSTETLLALGKGLTIDGLKIGSQEPIAKVENAFGGTRGFFRIKATQDTPLTLIRLDNMVYSQDVDQGNGIISHNTAILFLKDKTEDQIATTIQVDSSAKQASIYKTIGLTYCDTYASVTLKTESGGIVTVGTSPNDSGQRTSEILPGETRTFTTKFLETEALTADNTISDVSSGTVSISIDFMGTLPENWPNVNFEVKPYTIYSLDTINEYKFEESPSKKVIDDNNKESGLTGGEIAGIVIACIVVVGIIVFCVVWFAVLKKGCHSKRKTSNDE